MFDLLKRYFDPERMVKPEHRTGCPLPTVKESTGSLIRMAWPSVVETVLVAVISMVDTIMVGGLGHGAIAAVGLTAQPRLIILALFLSLNVGITALVARRKGEGDRETANKILRQSVLILTIGAIIVSILGVLFSPQIIKLMGANEDTLLMGTQYFEIMMAGIFFNIMSLAITAAQRGAGNTKISMRTNLTANLVNIVFNWLLIGGNLGFPALGVRGAAIATVFGYFVAFLMALFSVVRSPDSFLHFSFRKSFKLERRVMAPVIKVGSASAVEQLFFRIGFFVFTRVAASLGTVPLATHQICNNLMMVCFGFGEGFAIAASSLVGQSLGAKRPDLAIIYGRTAQRFGMIMAGGLVILLLSLRGTLILPFSREPEIISLGTQLIYVLALLCPGHVLQYLFSSCLRVGGDTKFVAVVTATSLMLGRTFLSWFLCIPMGFGLIGAWLGFVIDQYTRLIILSIRYKKGKWTRIAL